MTKTGKIFLSLFCIGAIITAIGIFTEVLTLMIIGPCLVIAAIVMMFAGTKQVSIQLEKNKQETFAKQHPHYEAEQFYKKCRKAGLTLTETASKATLARAKLIAEENQLSIPDDKIVETYFLGQSEESRLSTEEKYKSIYKRAKALEQTLSFRGREKEILDTQRALDYYTALYDYVAFGKALPVQKEQDWALMGGIAAGLAGGAAGVAVASDIQMKNAAIRESNAQLRKAYTKVALPALTKIAEEQKWWENRLEKAKHALVDDSSPEKLFEKLKISNESVYVFSDGSFVVQARAVVPHVKIYDTEDAVIDGSITAVVYQNGEKVGEAPIVLPRKGDVTYSNRIECDLIGASSSNGAMPNLSCEVEFKYRDLWAIAV